MIAEHVIDSVLNGTSVTDALKEDEISKVLSTIFNPYKETIWDLNRKK